MVEVTVYDRSRMCAMGVRIETARLIKTVWPSGLRRWLKAPVRKGVGSNPTAVTYPAQEEDSRHRPVRTAHT